MWLLCLATMLLEMSVQTFYVIYQDFYRFQNYGNLSYSSYAVMGLGDIIGRFGLAQISQIEVTVVPSKTNAKCNQIYTILD